MMKKLEKDYVPESIDFVLPQEIEIPEIIGSVKTFEECQKLVSGHLVAMNTGHTATRHMDVCEKDTVRKTYQEELEKNQPELDKRLSEARAELEEAKKNYKEIEDMYSASSTKVRDLAKQARIGTTDIRLDQASTWRVPLNNKYFFLTYMRGNLVVADVKDIPEHEKSDIFNSQAKNEEGMKKLCNQVKKAV